MGIFELIKRPDKVSIMYEAWEKNVVVVVVVFFIK